MVNPTNSFFVNKLRLEVITTDSRDKSLTLIKAELSQKCHPFNLNFELAIVQIQAILFEKHLHLLSLIFLQMSLFQDGLLILVIRKKKWIEGEPNATSINQKQYEKRWTQSGVRWCLSSFPVYNFFPSGIEEWLMKILIIIFNIQHCADWKLSPKPEFHALDILNIQLELTW